MSKGPYEIGELEFKDIKVKVYNDKYSTSNNCVWQMRNPDSCYVGPMFINYETGKVTYPEGTIIPEQNDRDREMLPKFLITGETEITEEYKTVTLEYLEKEYKRRNNTEIYHTNQNKEDG